MLGIGERRAYVRSVALSSTKETVTMRSCTLSAVVLAGLAGTPALAQPVIPMTPQGVPPGADLATGARPGNDIGTGMSLPMGNTASNINPTDTRSVISPNLPTPPIGANGSAMDYLRAAQGALAAGRTGEAQQALEMAETRLLDRSVPQFQTNNPSDNPGVGLISQALQALATGDRAQCMQLIQQVIPVTQAMAR